MTIRLVGKDKTQSVLNAIESFFKLTTYPYLTNIQVAALIEHLNHIRSWGQFDCSVQVGTVYELQKTQIIIEITRSATTPGVKQ